jgi:hypothetical protein
LFDLPSGDTEVNPRTKELVCNAGSRRPQTNRYCIRCAKDIKLNSPARSVHVIGGGSEILHPDDEAFYVPEPDGSDMGQHLVGSDCARIIELEWTSK